MHLVTLLGTWSTNRSLDTLENASPKSPKCKWSPGWPDWANFRPLGNTLGSFFNCSSSPNFSGCFFLRKKSYALILPKNVFWQHFGRLFLKLIRSLWWSLTFLALTHLSPLWIIYHWNCFVCNSRARLIIQSADIFYLPSARRFFCEILNWQLRAAEI
jgi:hypothetical protein